MGRDQVAAIYPELSELYHLARNEAPGGGKLCATFTVPGYPMIWVEVTPGMINVSYPHSTEPLEFLTGREITVLPELTVENWEPRRYATFSHGPVALPSVARFVDRLIAAVHAHEAEDYAIDVGFDRVTA
jgi:hypothetical protein